LTDLFEQKELNIQQKIVEELLNEKNLDRKTELAKPLRWSVMTTIENFLQSKQMALTQKIINDFTQLSFKYLISHERKSREEYIQALGNLTQPRLSEPVNQLMRKD